MWLSKTNRKKRVFPQKQSKREEGVGGVDSTFSSSRFEKSIHSVKAGGEKEPPKRELSTKKKELEKRTKKHGQKASFFQANRGEKNNVFLQKRV